MDEKLNRLLLKIKQLEQELLAELHKKGQEFGYEIKGRKVRFNKAVSTEHRKIARSLYRYVRHARYLSIVTAPIIWACIVPLLLLHLVVGFYQLVCFPIYGIPKVCRGDYIVLDRHNLSYLNIIEKMNCVYCGYFNGLVAYAREMAARTEQHWCPIKHARRVGGIHNRYKYFFDYGDANRYRQEIETARRDFEDIKKENL